MLLSMRESAENLSMCSSGYSQQARFGARNGPMEFTNPALLILIGLTFGGRIFVEIWQKSYALDVRTHQGMEKEITVTMPGTSRSHSFAVAISPPIGAGNVLFRQA